MTPAPIAPGLPPAPSPDAQSPPVEWEPRGTADLQTLDKIDNHAATMAVRVGQSAQFGRLTLAVRACVVRPADQAQDAAAYLDITDPSPGAPGFHGWMLAAEPSVSMLEHPVYDVRVLGCH
ncbi:MAG: DUF2155 domain-containing protein [Acidisphaera sp.]|nr:DUF2155 domain-containing protein [Acidisphaera sp.]